MEDAYLVKGGKPLSGAVKLSGAKNVALKVIIAALMLEGEVILKNIPRINDVFELLNLITSLGGKAQFADNGTVLVDGRGIKNNRVEFLYGSKIRVSFMLFAPLLHKFGIAYVPNPGGCRIGARPIDRIIEGMKSLGITVNYDSDTGYYEAKINDKIAGSYSFVKPSHTGTELLLLTSVISPTTSEKIIINNAALEPEIDELIRFLAESGAKIKREGKRIYIEPVKSLKRDNPFTIMADRNEAVTYAALAVATRGSIVISGIEGFLIETFIKKMKEVGADVTALNKGEFRFSCCRTLKSSNIETSPHPGFMTDWQPNWAVLMTQAQGQSIIHERVFENRFSYVEELKKLGAQIDFIKMPVSNPMEYFFFNFDPAKKYNQAVKIAGPQKLHGGVLNIADLRAGATLAIAALVAEGESVVTGASILERGYEDFVNKVVSLGGEIEKK
jgi:UDP-N-acetylglucosamine 1-carboxyvinyltransferase